MKNAKRLFVAWFLVAGVACSSDNSPAPADTQAATAKAPRGGTRLKAMLAESAEGIAVALGWWDSKLATHCSFEETAEGFRCMPVGEVLYTPPPVDTRLQYWFLDSDCKEQALPGSDSTKEGTLGRIYDLKCRGITGYFRVGPSLALGTGYVKSGDTCVPVSAEMPPKLHSTLPANLEEFVKATPVVDDTQSAIASVTLQGDDGSQQPFGLRDTIGGFDCAPTGTLEGLRCTPTNIASWQANQLYEDAACGQAVAVAMVVAMGGSECVRPPKEFRFVESRGFHGIMAIHEIGEPLSRVYELKEGMCVVSDVAANVFSFGPQLPLTRFASAEVTVEAKGPLGQTVRKAGTARMPEFDYVTSLKSGATCNLATTDDDVVRCAPEAWLQMVPEFADSACSKPVWYTGWPELSIEAPKRMAVKGAPGALLLPRVVRVLTGGEPYMGPVFSKRSNSTCEIVPNVPNSRQPYRIGMTEVSPRSLTAMPFVLR